LLLVRRRTLRMNGSCWIFDHDAYIHAAIYPEAITLA
jgi:hypothetical protein